MSRTHLSLTVTTDNQIARMEVFNHLARTATDLAPSFPDVMISSHEMTEEDEGEEEFFDEFTIFKVLKVFIDEGIPSHQAQQIIEHFQNKGIVFRERRQ